MHRVFYAGGTFDSIGGIAARRIACWNGTSWKALGAGISGDEVMAIAFDKAGNLYAGGKFEVAGSTVAHNIAMWDGISWRSLGEGIRKEPTSFHPVNALVVDHVGNVYAGGEFTQAGTTAASNIARWDGIAWHPLAEGICSRYSGVSALAVNPAGILFTGGSIYRAGNVPVYGIAQWDGQRWSALDEGVYSIVRYDTAFFPGSVTALFCDNTTLHVAGLFTNAGKHTSCNFAQYRFDQNTAHTLHSTTPAHSAILFDKRQASFRLHLKSDTHVQVGITNLMGKMIKNTYTTLPRGNHLVAIGTNTLPCGVYIVQIKAGIERSCSRFVVGR
ncbi:MAG: T9SS type A sorting domain-containing protein [Chitinispirillaceae bacterium]|nr:T9SS type A sorting domain-containing protein [Chitinispirillaceae bacterium]